MILDRASNNPLCPNHILLVLLLGFSFFRFCNFFFNILIKIILLENETNHVFPCSEILYAFYLVLKLSAWGHFVRKFAKLDSNKPPKAQFQNRAFQLWRKQKKNSSIITRLKAKHNQQGKKLPGIP